MAVASVPEFIEKINTDDNCKTDFVYALEEKVKKRMIQWYGWILSLTNFYKDSDGSYKAYGYAVVHRFERKGRPMVVTVPPNAQKVVVQIGVMVVEVPIEEVLSRMDELGSTCVERAR